MQKRQKKQKKEEKEKILTHSDYQNLLQIDINKLVRCIDNQYPCIATNKHTGKMNAGHYFSVGSNNSIRFNLHNIHKQSEHSNKFNHGDAIRYLIGIKKRYGVNYANYILSLPSLYNCIKLTKEELKEKRVVVKKLIKEFDTNKIYTPEEIIKIRNEFNKIIGIYDIEFSG